MRPRLRTTDMVESLYIATEETEFQREGTSVLDNGKVIFPVLRDANLRFLPEGTVIGIRNIVTWL